MSAAQLDRLLDNQAADAARIGDADLIEAWRTVADAQRPHNP